MLDEETLHDLYAWVDQIPLSRPKRNITRDFSDGVLTAELVKFHFPKLVEMHNYVPANSTQQKVSNWTILNRKVLGKLNFSVPDDVIGKVAHCSPGVVELVLNTLRQKIEEKQKQNQTSAESSQVQSPRAEANHNADTGYSTKHKTNGAEQSPRPAGKTDQGSKTQSGYSQGAGADSGLRIQLAEKEQELMAAQESVQVLRVKLRRMERLLQLKNVRIDDLSRRLQEAEDRRA